MADFFKNIYASFFAICIYVWLFITGLIAYACFLIIGFKENILRKFLYAQGRIIQFAIFCASGFDKKTIKRQMPDKPSILVANHPSTYDTFAFFSFGIKNLVCVAKGWPFKIIFYGKFIKYAGYINSDGKTADEIIDAVKEKLKSGLHVAIFPEGTRRKEPGRFRSLAFAAAISADTYVVPFVLKGLGEMLPPGKWMPACCPIVYEQLEYVYAGDFNYDAGDLRLAQYVKKIIVEKLSDTDKENK